MVDDEEKWDVTLAEVNWIDLCFSIAFSAIRIRVYPTAVAQIHLRSSGDEGDGSGDGSVGSCSDDLAADEKQIKRALNTHKHCE